MFGLAHGVHPASLAPLLRAAARSRAGLGLAGSVLGVETDQPHYALTFDDGPHPLVTPAVVDALGDSPHRATFFVTVRKAVRYPEIVRAVADAGHEIGVHGYGHERLTELGPRAFVRETHGARRAVRAATGIQPRWYRPPHGAQNLRTFFALRMQRMQVAMWTTSINDTVTTDVFTAEAAADGSLHLSTIEREGTLPKGGVLLLHDIPEHDVLRGEGAVRKAKVVSEILATLDAIGGRSMTLTELCRTAPVRRQVWRSDGY